MKFHNTTFYTACIAVFCFSSSVAHPDIVLTFEPNPGNGLQLDQNYGDRVTSTSQNGFSYGQTTSGFTPNVEVSYNDLFHWDGSYGDLSDVVYSAEQLTNISFVADAGFEVLLYGFDLAGWPNATYVIPSITVRDGNGSTLYFESDVVVNGDAQGTGHSSIFFGVPLRAAELHLEIDSSPFFASLVGIDNVRFAQTVSVPEPSSAILLIAFGAYVSAIRRCNVRV